VGSVVRLMNDNDVPLLNMASILVPIDMVWMEHSRSKDLITKVCQFAGLWVIMGWFRCMLYAWGSYIEDESGDENMHCLPAHFHATRRAYFRMLFVVYSELELNVVPWCRLLLTELLICSTFIATIQINIIDFHVSTACVFVRWQMGMTKIVWNHTNLSYLIIAPRWNGVSTRY
jgi:hypothetical protein